MIQHLAASALYFKLLINTLCSQSISRFISVASVAKYVGILYNDVFLISQNFYKLADFIEYCIFISSHSRYFVGTLFSFYMVLS